MKETSDSSPVLPHDVIQSIEYGNKIEAIKLLRERTGLGLKESKDLVDTYEENRPAGSPPIRRGDSSNGGLILVILICIIGYTIYRFLG